MYTRIYFKFFQLRSWFVHLVDPQQHLGAFHTMCSYMGALGKIMAGSGFEDILIESGICASGTVEKVLSGNHYNLALRVHQHMSDAVEHMLLHEFCESKKLSTSTQDDFNEMHFQL